MERRRRASPGAAYAAGLRPSAPARLARVIAEGVVSKPSEVSGLWGEETDELAIARARGPDPRRLRRNLIGDLDTIVLKSLHKDPRRRYGSVEQLSEDLRRHLEDLPVLARPDTPTYRLQKFVGRNRLASAGIVSIWLSAVAMGWFGYRAGVERQAAEQQRQRAETMASFTMDLFRESDPEVAQGAELTARDLLRQGAERVRRDFADQPDLQATMGEFIGNVYARLGLYRDAQPLLEDSLQLRQQNPATEPLVLAESKDLLADLLLDLGELERAQVLQGEALVLRERNVPAGHPVLADNHTDLGVILRRQGELDQSEEHLRQAMGLYQAHYGSQHPRVGTVLNNLASLLKDRGRIGEAAELMERALEIHRRELGEDHPKLALSLQNLGSLLLDLGELPKAVDTLKEAEEKVITLMGEAHLHTLVVQQNLAYGHWLRGDSEGAQEILERVVLTSQETLEPAHPVLLAALVRLAAILVERGETVAAREALEALEGADLDLKTRRPVLFAEVLMTRGELALSRGSGPDAQRFLDRAGAILKKQVPAGHPKYRRCQLDLAEASWASGNLMAAELRYEEALEYQRSVLPSEHPELAKPLLALAEIALQGGSREKAATRIEEARPLLEQLLPISWPAAVAASVEGALQQAGSGVSGDSEVSLQSAFEDLCRQRGCDAPVTRRAKERAGSSALKAKQIS